jgi:hypothetical protein
LLGLPCAVLGALSSFDYVHSPPRGFKILRNYRLDRLSLLGVSTVSLVQRRRAVSED